MQVLPRLDAMADRSTREIARQERNSEAARKRSALSPSFREVLGKTTRSRKRAVSTSQRRDDAVRPNTRSFVEERLARARSVQSAIRLPQSPTAQLRQITGHRQSRRYEEGP